MCLFYFDGVPHRGSDDVAAHCWLDESALLWMWEISSMGMSSWKASWMYDALLDASKKTPVISGLRTSPFSFDPDDVKQDVNFLESSEISLHKTTVSCDRTPASVLLPEKRIISASLWKSSMERAVSSARLLMAAV